MNVAKLFCMPLTPFAGKIDEAYPVVKIIPSSIPKVEEVTVKVPDWLLLHKTVALVIDTPEPTIFCANVIELATITMYPLIFSLFTSNRHS